MILSKEEGISVQKIFSITVLVVLLISFGYLVNFLLVDSDSIDYNPYLRELPKRYVRALKDQPKITPTFFASVYENYGIREVLIFKKNPAKKDKFVKFKIELHISESDKNKSKNSNTIVLKPDKKIAYFQNNEKRYSLISIPIPQINIDKINIEKINNTKKKKTWSTVIDKPFSKIDKNSDILIKDSKDNLDVTFALNPYLPVFNKFLNKFEISYVPYEYYKSQNDSLVILKPSLNKYTKNQNTTITSFSSQKQFWEFVNEPNEDIKEMIEFKGPKSSKANKLLSKFSDSNISFEEAFDKGKFINYMILNSLFFGECKEELVVKYNEKTNLFEPLHYNSECLGDVVTHDLNPSINNLEILSDFTKALYDLSRLDIYNNIIKQIDYFEEELQLINSYDNEIVFNYDVIEINQRNIAKLLDVSKVLESEVVSIDSKKAVISVYNSGVLPVTVKSLNYKKNKIIANLESNKTILEGEKDTILFYLPRSFENLFVNKKTKEVGFSLFKDTYDLSISYSPIGLNNINHTNIKPYSQLKKPTIDIFREKNKYLNDDRLKVNENKRIITLNGNNITINSPLIIPKGYHFKLNPGNKIDIISGGKIISHSPLNFNGSKENPIQFYSSDNQGQGILVLANNLESILRHVEFNNLSNPKHGAWNVTGAVTFYESPVNLEYVFIKNNSCEDALNIVRTNFTMKHCEISNTQSDAFDGDFVQGIITQSKFNYLGNDGIDVSGSDLKIENVTVFNAGDKGLSAGEDSKMLINNVEVRDSEIAVAGKDLSIVNITDLKIVNTKLGFTAFQKKPEFGPSHVKVVGVTMENVETNYLIESSSSLIVDGQKIETSQNVKDRMYGVEFGVSSAETRNSN